jgi:hypothetical protein
MGRDGTSPVGANSITRRRYVVRLVRLRMYSFDFDPHVEEIEGDTKSLKGGLAREKQVPLNA